MPIPSTATYQLFAEQAYMIEVFWLAVVWNGISGVMVYRSYDTRDWEAFFLEEVPPGCILGDPIMEWLGPVSEVHPEINRLPRMPILQFLLRIWQGHPPHPRFTTHGVGIAGRSIRMTAHGMRVTGISKTR